MTSPEVTAALPQSEDGANVVVAAVASSVSSGTLPVSSTSSTERLCGSRSLPAVADRLTTCGANAAAVEIQSATPAEGRPLHTSSRRATINSGGGSHGQLAAAAWRRASIADSTDAPLLTRSCRADRFPCVLLAALRCPRSPCAGAELPVSGVAAASMSKLSSPSMPCVPCSQNSRSSSSNSCSCCSEDCSVVSPPLPLPLAASSSPQSAVSTPEEYFTAASLPHSEEIQCPLSCFPCPSSTTDSTVATPVALSDLLDGTGGAAASSPATASLGTQSSGSTDLVEHVCAGASALESYPISSNNSNSSVGVEPRCLPAESARVLAYVLTPGSLATGRRPAVPCASSVASDCDGTASSDTSNEAQCKRSSVSKSCCEGERGTYCGRAEFGEQREIFPTPVRTTDAAAAASSVSAEEPPLDGSSRVHVGFSLAQLAREAHRHMEKQLWGWIDPAFIQLDDLPQSLRGGGSKLKESRRVDGVQVVVRAVRSSFLYDGTAPAAASPHALSPTSHEAMERRCVQCQLAPLLADRLWSLRTVRHRSVASVLDIFTLATMLREQEGHLRCSGSDSSSGDSCSGELTAARATATAAAAATLSSRVAGAPPAVAPPVVAHLVGRLKDMGVGVPTVAAAATTVARAGDDQGTRAPLPRTEDNHATSSSDSNNGRERQQSPAPTRRHSRAKDVLLHTTDADLAARGWCVQDPASRATSRPRWNAVPSPVADVRASVFLYARQYVSQARSLHYHITQAWGLDYAAALPLHPSLRARWQQTHRAASPTSASSGVSSVPLVPLCALNPTHPLASYSNLADIVWQILDALYAIQQQQQQQRHRHRFCFLHSPPSGASPHDGCDCCGRCYHGNLKPKNVLLANSTMAVFVTDHGLPLFPDELKCSTEQKTVLVQSTPSAAACGEDGAHSGWSATYTRLRRPSHRRFHTYGCATPCSTHPHCAADGEDSAADELLLLQHLCAPECVLLIAQAEPSAAADADLWVNEGARSSKSDVYAVGVMAYMLLFGHCPRLPPYPLVRVEPTASVDAAAAESSGKRYVPVNDVKECAAAANATFRECLRAELLESSVPRELAGLLRGLLDPCSAARLSLSAARCHEFFCAHGGPQTTQGAQRARRVQQAVEPQQQQPQQRSFPNVSVGQSMRSLPSSQSLGVSSVSLGSPPLPPSSSSEMAACPCDGRCSRPTDGLEGRRDNSLSFDVSCTTSSSASSSRRRGRGVCAHGAVRALLAAPLLFARTDTPPCMAEPPEAVPSLPWRARAQWEDGREHGAVDNHSRDGGDDEAEAAVDAQPKGHARSAARPTGPDASHDDSTSSGSLASGESAAQRPAARVTWRRCLRHPFTARPPLSSCSSLSTLSSCSSLSTSAGRGGLAAARPRPILSIAPSRTRRVLSCATATTMTAFAASAATVTAARARLASGGAVWFVVLFAAKVRRRALLHQPRLRPRAAAAAPAHRAAPHRLSLSFTSSPALFSAAAAHARAMDESEPIPAMLATSNRPAAHSSTARSAPLPSAARVRSLRSRGAARRSQTTRQRCRESNSTSATLRKQPFCVASERERGPRSRLDSAVSADARAKHCTSSSSSTTSSKQSTGRQRDGAEREGN